MRTTLEYSEISKIIKQATDIDIAIKYIERPYFPIHINATVKLPIIGRYTIKANCHFIYKDNLLYIAYNMCWLYRIILPNIIKYLRTKGLRKCFTKEKNKNVFIVNLSEINACKQIFEYVTVKKLRFGHVIFTEFDVNINKNANKLYNYEKI